MKKLRHVKQHILFVKDYVVNNEIEIKHVNIEDMVADIFTKPLQGDLFRRLRTACGLYEDA